MLPILYKRHVHLKMTTFVDLECFFNRRGKPRTFTRFFQAAMVTPNEDKTMWTDPLPEWDIDTPIDLINALYDSGARPNPSILFWSKTLRHANHKVYTPIYKSLKDTDFEPLPRIEDTTLVHCHAITRLLQHWRETNTGKLEEDFLHYMVKKAKANTGEVVAHNGRAFDFRVLAGAASRSGTSLTDVTFIDSLPLFKKKWPDLKSYSQPKLYKHIFPKESYRAHDALEDARALQQLWNKAYPPSLKPPTSPIAVKEYTMPPLDAVPGIGPKTVIKLAKKGITTMEQLKRRYKERGTLRGDVHLYSKADAYSACLDGLRL